MTPGFRSLTEDDLPLLQRWLNTPHVLEWWDTPGPSVKQVREKYIPRIHGEEPVQCYIMLWNDAPVGFIQAYEVEEGSEYAPYVSDVGRAVGVDLFIGEEMHLHRGLGGRLLRRFVEDMVFEMPGVRACVIDPSARNRIAIRAYERAGFRHVATFRLPEERDDTYLMRMGAESSA